MIVLTTAFKSESGQIFRTFKEALKDDIEQMYRKWKRRDSFICIRDYPSYFVDFLFDNKKEIIKLLNEID